MRWLLVLGIFLSSFPASSAAACDVEVRHFNTPLYPALARQMKVQGTVTAKIEVTADGKVARVSEVAGPPPLKSVVSESLKTWTFSKCEGGAAITIAFNFRLVGPTSERNVTTAVSGDWPRSMTVEAMLPEEPGPDVATH